MKSQIKRSQVVRTLLLAGISTVAAAAIHPGVRAQSVDYGALEQLYGEPVTTSATGKPQKVSEVPANMEIITQDEIRRSGATTIPDVLQFVTGVDVRRNAYGDYSVGIRGYNQPVNSRLLVLVNGQQVYQDDYGYVPWATIPVALDEIRQIEIVKGPSTIAVSRLRHGWGDPETEADQRLLHRDGQTWLQFDGKGNTRPRRGTIQSVGDNRDGGDPNPTPGDRQRDRQILSVLFSLPRYMPSSSGSVLR